MPPLAEQYYYLNKDSHLATMPKSQVASYHFQRGPNIQIKNSLEAPMNQNQYT